MIIKIKKRVLEESAAALMLILLLAALLAGISVTGDFIAAVNVTNATVIARVNVTNTGPNITSVLLDDDTNSPAGQIDLTANGVTIATCNATVFDINGAADINESATNATLYVQPMTSSGSTDNNFRYRNESCGRCTQITATTTACDCRFPLQYYTNDSSSWLCNITVTDKGGTATSSNILRQSDSETSGAVTVTQLLALNTGNLLDYGNLSVTQTSPEIVQNVTNVGNINLNISLYGFGGINDSIDNPGHNLTMICDFGNISIGNQRYALGTDQSGTSFTDMRILTNQTAVTNLTLPSRIDDSAFGHDRNSTLWKLQVPAGVGGICNGTIIFGVVNTE